MLYNSPEQRIIDKHYNDAKDLYSNLQHSERYTLTWKKIRETLRTSLDIEHIPNNIYFDCYGNRIRRLFKEEDLEQRPTEEETEQMQTEELRLPIRTSVTSGTSIDERQ